MNRSRPTNPWKLPRRLAHLLPYGVDREKNPEATTFGDEVEQAWIDRTGETPLHVYFRHCPMRQTRPNVWRPVFDELAALGYDVNARSAMGGTALSEAMPDAGFGWIHVVLLLKLGADPLETDPAGNTLLHHAVSGFHEWGGPTLQDLLAIPGMPISAQNLAGETVLHKVCDGAMCEEVQDVERLLAAGIDVTKRDAQGLTALDRLQRGMDHQREQHVLAMHRLLESATLRAVAHQVVPTAEVGRSSRRRL